jgi:ArsR family transcriptional regulator, lead/cadmium/zinc/bismuth-responsive transcriptional repressor
MGDSSACDLLCLDLAKAEAVRSAQPVAAQIEAAADRAHALGDPTRLAVASALAGADELCVCDLAWITGRSDKLVSHHARVLRTAGLATSRREGKMVMYRLTDAGRGLLGAVLPTTVPT